MKIKDEIKSLNANKDEIKIKINIRDKIKYR